MSVAIITGAAGLVGSESVEHFANLGLDVVGIDNNMRKNFFGATASTGDVLEHLSTTVPRFSHVDEDIRNWEAIDRLFSRYRTEISLVIHAAAQPSHDWAASHPFTDFTVNANGTLNLLEATRRNAPQATVIFLSTNKLYGDRPNKLPLYELETRWEIDPSHKYQAGIPERMSIDATTHSLFGVSKTSADLLVQEYGRYFQMNTACFRCGCLTGPNHSGVMLHGFLSHLVRCALTETPYTIFGHKGKQVRDNLHSKDLARAFELFWRNPRSAEIYNMGGGRVSNCSMLEAIAITEDITGKSLQTTYDPVNRIGDHKWWISDLTRFQEQFPSWSVSYNTANVISAIAERVALRSRTPLIG